MAYNNIHFIVNPASGAGQIPFNIMGEFMAKFESRTTMHLTKVTYGVRKCVADAISGKADLVIVYGGDGTIMEVANCLHESNIPMGIIPGGTANIVAHELHIPLDARQALEVIFNRDEGHDVRWLDAGRIQDKHFLLRMSLGWEAELSQRPTAQDKASWGTLAYTGAALAALQDLEPVTYEITLDDDTVETATGINCSICNIGSVGLFGFSIGLGIAPDDGLLDVLILQSKNAQAIMDITQSVLASSLPLDLEERLIQYRAKKITVTPSASQLMSYDGEALESTFPVSIECVPQYVSIVAPKIDKIV